MQAYRQFNSTMLRGILPWVVAAIFLSSCARKMNFGVSPVVPAAQGYVKVKTDKNKNYAINVLVKNLATPDRLSPARNDYVVWMETDQGIRNIGKLKSKTKLVTRRLRASLQTVTTFKPTDFFITAEDDAEVLYPGTMTILRTN